MIFRLFRLELRAIRSDGRSVALVAITLAMLLLSAWIGADAQKVAAEGRAEAMEVSRAQWESIQGLSAHAGRDDLLHWLGSFAPAPRRVFVTHGEESASLAFADRLREDLRVDATVPRYLDEVSLDGARLDSPG